MNTPITHAIEKAIFTLQQIAMAHPDSSVHSKAMYYAAEDARHGLMKILTLIPKQ